MFRLSSRFTTNTAAHAVQCVRTLALDSHRGAHAVLGSANLTRMRGITGVLAQSASYSSVPRQMTQQMTLKEIGIMGRALLRMECFQVYLFGTQLRLVRLIFDFFSRR